jgi:hypothetical protein
MTLLNWTTKTYESSVNLTLNLETRNEPSVGNQRSYE